MNHADAYQQTLDYLYSYVDFSMTRGHRYSADQFDLGRMRILMTRLGNPEGKYPSIHIAGTKGKGSVAALCLSALMADGYRTGLYTSPHLHDYTERIQINGTPISHSDLIHLVEENKTVFESIPQLTTFEITTALAFLYFARREVDAAVIEVGLGRRLDATNVIIPIVAVITSLSYDHTYLLGDTLAEIAGEKAGALREAKFALRRRVLELRDTLPVDARAAASRAIGTRIAALPSFASARIALLTLAFRSEWDTSALVAAAFAAGTNVAVPRVDPVARMLTLHVVADLERDTAPGHQGIPEPRAHCPNIAPGHVDWVLVPGVAFDAEGRRLGYGGGYYDRLLTLLPSATVRVAGAFDMQVVDCVPASAQDLRVDIVITEARTQTCAR